MREDGRQSTGSREAREAFFQLEFFFQAALMSIGHVPKAQPKWCVEKCTNTPSLFLTLSRVHVCT